MLVRCLLYIQYTFYLCGNQPRGKRNYSEVEGSTATKIAVSKPEKQNFLGGLK